MSSLISQQLIIHGSQMPVPRRQITSNLTDEKFSSSLNNKIKIQ